MSDYRPALTRTVSVAGHRELSSGAQREPTPSPAGCQTLERRTREGRSSGETHSSGRRRRPLPVLRGSSAAHAVAFIPLRPDKCECKEPLPNGAPTLAGGACNA